MTLILIRWLSLPYGAVVSFIYRNNFMGSLLTTLDSNLKPQTRKSQPFRFNETLPLKTQ